MTAHPTRKGISLTATAILAFAVWFGSGAAAAAGTVEPSPPDGHRIAAVEPAAGAVVGVGHPVVVRFTDPVPEPERHAWERTVQIDTPAPVPGSFTWPNSRELHWTPDGLWPGNVPVTVLAGGSRTAFRVGDSFVAVANRSTHLFTVSLNGAVVRTMPASLGKPGYDTPLGTFTVLEKFRDLVMDSSTYGVPIDAPEGYRIDTEYAVRLTWGGIFVHAAPWSVESQGNANVSHGCINLGTDNARWYYDNVKIGDPVIVEG